MDPKPDDRIELFANSDAFDRWLARHHAKVPVVWIKHARKGSGQPSITWTEAVDVALCYGWIDGQSKSLDERYFLQRYTPRRPTSGWSKINRERVARLIADGRMQPSGLVQVERAQQDGRWDAAYDSPKNAVVPDDLAATLARHPTAKAAFAKLTGMNRYSILHRLQVAKQPQTRARQIAAVVAKLEAETATATATSPAKRKPVAKAATKARARKGG